MKRLFIFWVILLPALTQHVHAQYYSVNYDARTVAAMAAAFGTEAVAESYYREQVDDILKHYTAAEVAAAGIFSSKFLEHKALSDLGIWCSSTENYYYRRIYHMVAEKIMPKIWVVAKLMLRSPQTAIHWGSYLMKVCDDTKSLCMQFESVVTNSTLSFSDIAFLEIDRDIATLLNLAELGGTDWQRMLDNFTKVPGNFTIENLKGDIDNLYNMGVGLATSGMENLGDALLQSSAFHDLLGGKVNEIGNLYEHYGTLFEQAEHDIGSLLIDMVGGQDSVAALFNFSNYDLTSWMTDYMDNAVGNYYTQRWYIARRDQGSISLCDYYPPTDDNSILNGGAWTRFNTSDPGFYPNASQREQALANSERYAGWSRSRVQQLNNSNDGYTYTINTRQQAYIISKGNKQTKKAYAYEIHVTQSWNRMEVVYEDEDVIVVNKPVGMVVHPAASFRHIAVQSGASITGISLLPPHDHLGEVIGPLLPSGNDNAQVLKSLMKLAHQVLDHHPINEQRRAEGKRPANGVWFWAEGSAVALESFWEKYHKTGTVISAVPLCFGIARLSGLDIREVPGSTGELDTNYEGKVAAALEELRSGKDFVAVHVEAPDECTHNGDLPGKLQAIEWLDSRVVGPLTQALAEEGTDYRLLILSDHKTLTATRGHDADPVPYLLYDSRKDTGLGLPYCEESGQKGPAYPAGAPVLMKKLFAL